jgi:hypothetical protein
MPRTSAAGFGSAAIPSGRIAIVAFTCDDVVVVTSSGTSGVDNPSGVTSA